MRANYHSPLVKRTFALGVANGALWQLADAFLNPSTVVPAFILALGRGDKVWIGVIMACMNCGWLWPQLFLGKYLGTKQRLLPYYWVSAVGRGLTMIVLTAVVAFAYDARPGVVFAIVAALFMLHGSLGALGTIPFMTIVSDSMPASLRGRFFGLRWLIGGALGMASGIVVKQVLAGGSGPVNPRSYVTLFALGSGVYILSVLCFSLVREPPHDLQRHELSLPMELARGPRLLRRDRDWRLLLWSRACDAVAGGLTIPYMAPFALQYLKAQESVVGIFLFCQAGAGAASNLLWSYLGDRRGNRKLLMVSSAASVLPAAIALLSLAVPPVPLGTWFGVPFTLRLLVFSIAFIPLGFWVSGMAMGQTNYLLDIAPNRRRSTYLAFSSLVAFPLAWWPVGGALIIGESRFVLGFTVALAAAIGTFVTTVRLQEPRAAHLGLGDAPVAVAHTDERSAAAGGA